MHAPLHLVLQDSTTILPLPLASHNATQATTLTPFPAAASLANLLVLSVLGCRPTVWGASQSAESPNISTSTHAMQPALLEPTPS